MDFREQLKQLERQKQLRILRTVEPQPEGFAMMNNRHLLNLSSNDYLGLGTNEKLKNEFLKLLREHPDWFSLTSSSSRLLSGNSQLYDQTEELLTMLYGRPALFFNSGYHANIAVLPALTTKIDLILSDKLVHASLIDGIQLSSAHHIRYRHNDYDHLRKILNEKRKSYDQVYIVTESIFSMDGDLSDISVLIQLKKEFDLKLYIDEAHAVGVRGNKGLGICEELNSIENIDIIIGTMGKALGSVGAYVICNEHIKQWLINKARTFIFTTALPPLNMAWSHFILSKLPGFRYERHQLKKRTRQMASSLKANQLNADANSHIIPVIIGDNETTVKLSEYLYCKGFLVIPIRPPTVPQGSSRLRLSLSSSMHWDDLQTLGVEIRSFLNK